MTAHDDPGRQANDEPLSERDTQFAKESMEKLHHAIGHVVIGQDHVIEELLVGILSGGHILLEGIPGVGKTLLARSIAHCFALSFQRIQFTPDLMPSDVVGTSLWNQDQRLWEFHEGPIFSNILMADEINRTPPKTQAALLEAMEERQVTIDGTKHLLPQPFFVVATENPLDFEGTYPLPEAQKDRFLLKIIMSYPTEQAEAQLLTQGQAASIPVSATQTEGITKEQLRELRSLTARVHLEQRMIDYLLRLLRATRQSPLIRLGASPRAGLMWRTASQAKALLSGRAYVTPDDMKEVGLAVLRHRLSLSTQAELDGLDVDQVLTDLLEQVPVP